MISYSRFDKIGRAAAHHLQERDLAPGSDRFVRKSSLKVKMAWAGGATRILVMRARSYFKLPLEKRRVARVYIMSDISMIGTTRRFGQPIAMT
jgi:hypothetical protein